MIPITEEYGIWHPQEGIVNGHYHPTERDKINKIGQLRVGVSKLIEDEDQNPLTEDFVDQTKEPYLINKINVFKKLLKSINPKHDEAE